MVGLFCSVRLGYYYLHCQLFCLQAMICKHCWAPVWRTLLMTVASAIYVYIHMALATVSLHIYICIYIFFRTIDIFLRELLVSFAALLLFLTVLYAWRKVLSWLAVLSGTQLLNYLLLQPFLRWSLTKSIISSSFRKRHHKGEVITLLLLLG